MNGYVNNFGALNRKKSLLAQKNERQHSLNYNLINLNRKNSIQTMQQSTSQNFSSLGLQNVNVPSAVVVCPDATEFQTLFRKELKKFKAFLENEEFQAMTQNKPKFNQGVQMLEKLSSKFNDQSSFYNKVPELGQISQEILKLILE